MAEKFAGIMRIAPMTDCTRCLSALSFKSIFLLIRLVAQTQAGSLFTNARQLAFIFINGV
jgi:hypothetical protein